MAEDLLSVAARVTQVLDRLGIAYVIGGSLASAVHSFPRTTNDVDLVADVRPCDVAPLVAELQGAFYIDADAVADAVRRGTSFNAIHFDTALKVDVFVQGQDPFRAAQVARRREETLEESCVPVLSPEDTILAKLLWYRDGGGVSDRQWRDVVDVIAVQHERLDAGYLQAAAERMGLTDLLSRALVEVGPQEPKTDR